MTQPRRSLLISAGVAAGLSLGCAVLLYATVGATLGLFFGGVVVVTLLLPPMILAEQAPLRQGVCASAVNDAVGLAWLVAALTSRTTLGDWLACYLLLAAYSFALWGFVRMLHIFFGLPAVPASAITITIAALWLTWPIWLSRAINDAMIDLLVPAHPLLAINGVLTHLGIWSEQPIAYRQLMNLGQDIAYTLPRGILAGVFIHVILGGVGFALSSLRSAQQPAAA